MYSVVNALRSFGNLNAMYAMIWLSIERFQLIVMMQFLMGKFSYCRGTCGLIFVHFLAAVNVATHFLFFGANDSIYHDYISAFASVIIPYIITSIMYCLVARRLLQTVSSSTVLKRKLFTKRHKTAYGLLLFTAATAVCFIPYSVVTLMDAYPSTRLSNFISVNLLSFSNFFIFWLENIFRCLCNAMLLFVLSSKLQKYIEKFFSKFDTLKCTVCSVHYREKVTA